MKKRLLSGFVAVGVILSVGASSGGAVAPSGEAAYNTFCSKCHGLKGAGTDKGPPFVNSIYKPSHHSDMSFRWAAERGVVAHHWSFGNMPKVTGVKPDELESIIKYIRAVQADAGIK